MEIAPCPNCQKKLQVPEEFFGQIVQCPECKETFTAKPPETFQGGGPIPVPSPPPRRSDRRSWDDEDEDRDPELAPQNQRRPRYEEPEEDYRDRFARRRAMAPHRAGTILALSIISIVCCCTIFTAIPAWIMGNNDLAEMKAGRMDPSGEDMTQAGRIIGIIVTMLSIVAFCGYASIFALIGANGGFR